MEEYMIETSATLQDLLTELEQIRTDLEIQKRMLKEMGLLSEEMIDFVRGFKKAGRDHDDEYEKEIRSKKDEEEQKRRWRDVD